MQKEGLTCLNPLSGVGGFSPQTEKDATIERLKSLNPLSGVGGFSPRYRWAPT